MKKRTLVFLAAVFAAITLYIASCRDDDKVKPFEGLIDIDGNRYNTVVIGDQEWMAANLRTTRYDDGTSIQAGLSNSEWASTNEGAYAVYPHDDVDGIDSESAMVTAFGKLYNWHAVVDNRCLCPEGWRVPSLNDWNKLLDYIKDKYGIENTNSADGAGNALKSCRQDGSPLSGDCNTDRHPRWDFHDTHHGTDLFGFSALPAATRTSNGNFSVENAGEHVRFWTSTEATATQARRLYTEYKRGDMIGAGHNVAKRAGLSVRCMKDVDDPNDNGDPDKESRIMIPPDRDQGLIFYVEDISDVNAYYYGSYSPELLDVTHMNVQHDEEAPVVIMFDEDFYPIHWMFEDLTIAVIRTGKGGDNRNETTHIMTCIEGENSLTFNIELEDALEIIITDLAEKFAGELAKPLKDAKDYANKLGVAHKTYGELVNIARNGPGDREAHSTLASVISVGAVGEKVFNNFNIPGVPLQKTLGQMLGYLNRIADGHYDGSDIEGPTVDMLLCRGQSIIPGHCNHYYLYHKPGNVTKCVQRCIVTLKCFTDICHPLVMSVDEAVRFRDNH